MWNHPHTLDLLIYFSNSKAKKIISIAEKNNKYFNKNIINNDPFIDSTIFLMEMMLELTLQRVGF